MVTSRSARINGDPDRYIRNAKGGKYEARPYHNGRRHYLGIFATKGAARIAIRKFFDKELTAKPRFTKKIHTRQGEFYIAIVCIPYAEGMTIKKTRRLGGRFTTAAEAQKVAIEFLDNTVGEDARAAMMARK